MVPILSSIVLGKKDINTSRAFLLSTVYVLGMALIYALIGVLIVYLGEKYNVQLYLQHPITLMVIAGLFLILALAMFGIFELRLPNALQQRIAGWNQSLEGGSYTNVFLMGALSAVVVSPCVSAPLAGILIYLSASGDLLYGATTLFLLAIGMGVPLIAISVFGTQFLPKSGPWLDVIKKLLAWLLVGVAFWLLRRFLSDSMDLFLHAIWFIGLAFIFGLATFKSIASPLKVLALLSLLYGLVFGFQTAQTVFNEADEKTIESTSVKITLVENEGAMLKQIEINAQQGFYTIVDVYADWCISCKIMEDHIFKQPSVHEMLSKCRFIKYDASDVNDQTHQFFSKYQIKGLPNIMLFDSVGNEVRSQRILGEKTKDEFLQLMQQATTSDQ